MRELSALLSPIAFMLGCCFGLAASYPPTPPIVIGWHAPVVVPVPVRAPDVRDMLQGCAEASIECRSTRRVDLLSEDLDRTREIVCTCDEAP